mmetsp:Transcript_29483/g.43492  ORF Transcript_29483/g.43492 Transcript_29483/m.43492 type:complete len:110 (+) Transcript_29483:27-356(+)
MLNVDLSDELPSSSSGSEREFVATDAGHVITTAVFVYGCIALGTIDQELPQSLEDGFDFVDSHGHRLSCLALRTFQGPFGIIIGGAERNGRSTMRAGLNRLEIHDLFLK